MVGTTIARRFANGAGEGSTSGVTWSAIIAGAVAAAAIALILLVLGMGPGLTAISPWAFSGVSGTTLQVYAIYAPAHHKPGKVQATAAAAEADKDDKPAAWSVQPKHVPDKHG